MTYQNRFDKAENDFMVAVQDAIDGAQLNNWPEVMDAARAIMAVGDDYDDPQSPAAVEANNEAWDAARKAARVYAEAEANDYLYTGDDWETWLGDSDPEDYADDNDETETLITEAIDTLYGREYTEATRSVLVRRLTEYADAELAAKIDLDEVMTVKEIATEYALGERGIRATIERGSIPARQSGKTWLMRRTDVIDQWGCPSKKAQKMANEYLLGHPWLNEDFDIHADGEWYTFEVRNRRGYKSARYAYAGPRKR